MATTGTVLADEVAWARSRRERARGLIGRRLLVAGEALVIEPARQVHTVGMRYAIDVVFCDRDWGVLHVVRGLRPNRITRWVPGARYVIELPDGSVPAELERGHTLSVTSTGSRSDLS